MDELDDSTFVSQKLENFPWVSGYSVGHSFRLFILYAAWPHVVFMSTLVIFGEIWSWFNYFHEHRELEPNDHGAGLVRLSKSLVGGYPLMYYGMFIIIIIIMYIRISNVYPNY